ncbi:acetylglutamate kinase [Flexibacterium corallicola]|uniref:acetylglutamate kinase n=1 Tax=Flexibacterium corallicola TaxID=3037259 RepID=UPI00286F19B8|nr:acetylglutamate kinase [Pseudovibrio sp. M1P-2-3]
MSSTEAKNRAHIIAQALPYMQRYDKRRVVIKYGGNAMGDETLTQAFARDVTLLRQAGVHPVVVHGGGPQIGAMLKRLDIKSEFKGGLRVTDKATVSIVEMVLAGSINKNIVHSINKEGGRAIGLSGKDGDMVMARKLHRKHRDPDSKIEEILDLGFVGEPESVNSTTLEMILQQDLIPVLAPVAPGRDGETYNINADTFAGAIAGSINAKRLLFLTDVPGVLDKEGNLIKKLTVAEVRALIEDGTISGGMIPKVETCMEALDRGVEGVMIVDGKVEHSILLELFTDHGVGTLIVP